MTTTNTNQNNTKDNDVIAITGTETIDTEAPRSDFTSSVMSFIPMLLIFVVFYFLIIRPQEKRRKEQEGLTNSVKRGEEILTNGGIYAKVVKVNEVEPTILVEIAENVQVKIVKSAIIDIVSRSKEAKAQALANSKNSISK